MYCPSTRLSHVTPGTARAGLGWMRLALVLCLSSATPAAAAQTSDRTARAHPIDQPPLIDGVLDEEAWLQAPVIAEFRQKEPTEGEAASERTRVRVVFDDTQLYIGVEALDGEPSEIRATELRRDNTLESDDSFSVLLDTFHDHRNAFLFRINPRGTRFDGLIRNEGNRISNDWDEQWVAAATVRACQTITDFCVLGAAGWIV